MGSYEERIAKLEQEVWEGNGDEALKVRVAKLETNMEHEHQIIRDLIERSRHKENIVLGASVTAALSGLGWLFAHFILHV